MNGTRQLVITLVIGFLALGASSGYGQNSLVSNGSLESASVNPCPTLLRLPVGSTAISGWTVVQNAIHYECGSWQGTNGPRSVDLDGNPGEAGGIAQTFATTAGTHYVVTFDLAGNYANAPAIKTMRVSADGQFADFTFDITGKSAQNMGWTPKAWAFVADDSSATLAFTSLTSPAGWGPALDNVQVHAATTIVPPCFSTHAKGSGPTLFSVCFSEVGTIVRLESPAGFEHVATGPTGEGYAVCSTSGVHGYEAGVESLGFAQPAVTQPNGPNTFPLTIVRTTADGVFQITQTYAVDFVEHDLTVTIIIKNVSAASAANVRFSRYVHAAVDNGAGQEIADAAADTASARHTHILGLTASTFATPHTAVVEGFTDWDPLIGAGTARGCDAFPQSVPTAPGDFVSRATYSLGTLGAGKSKTIKFLYRRL